jgi:IS605 OrfB family transposase
VDRFGNASNKPDRFGRIDLNLKGKTSEQREAILSQALDQVFDIAKKFSCPAGMEDLDFAAKKRELSKLGVKHARMLSGLAYSKYQLLARSKASRLGIELIFVDPAYTSVAASVKYCVRLGRTVHQTAAGVIARRSQGFTEKVPKRNEDGSTTFRAPLMGHTAVLTLPAESGKRTCVTWGDIRKSLTRHCAEQVRLRKEASRNRSKSESVNMQLLNGDTSLFREPGESLARRHANPPDLPDVPL